MHGWIPRADTSVIEIAQALYTLHADPFIVALSVEFLHTSGCSVSHRFILELCEAEFEVRIP